jgi:hypothetical protein
MRIELPIKMVSENTALRCIMRKKFASPTKSTEIKVFEKNIHLAIKPYIEELKNLMLTYEKRKHAIELSIIHKTPKLFTLKKTINENSIDVDNIKYLIDRLFDYVPSAKDSQIVALHSYKEYAKEHSIVVNINIVNFCYENFIF